MITRLKELLFKNKSTRQTITKNVFWLSMSQVGSRLIRAIIIIYAARILGAGEYGVFSYALGLAGFFTVFADIGVNQLLTRETAAYPDQRAQFFSTSFWVKTVLLLFTVLLIIFVAPHVSKIEESASLIPFIALLVISDGIREFAIAFLRGKEKMEWEAFITIAMNVAIVVAGFIILKFSPTSKALLFSYIASVGFSALLSIFILRKQFASIYYFNKNLALKIINTCWPIAFSSMLGVFMLNTDMIMLGWWRTAEEIGYYSAGQRVIGVLYTLPSLLASATFPIIARFIKDGEKEKERILNEKSMTLILSITLPLVIGGIVLGRPIIELLFGKEYLPGVLTFQVLLLTLLLMFPGILLGGLVLGHNQQKRFVGYIAAGSLGNIVFNTLLIPAYGIVGSAIATLIAFFLNVGLTWRHIKRVSNFQTLRYLKKISAAAVLMGILSFVLNKAGLNVIVNIVISAGFYFGVLYLLKEEILDEVKILFERIKK